MNPHMNLCLHPAAQFNCTSVPKLSCADRGHEDAMRRLNYTRRLHDRGFNLVRLRGGLRF